MLKTIFKKSIVMLIMLALSLTVMSFSALAEDVKMSVSVDGAEAQDFTDFGNGWVYALKQSISKPVTITLGAD